MATGFMSSVSRLFNGKGKNKNSYPEAAENTNKLLDVSSPSSPKGTEESAKSTVKKRERTKTQTVDPSSSSSHAKRGDHSKRRSPLFASLRKRTRPLSCFVARPESPTESQEIWKAVDNGKKTHKDRKSPHGEGKNSASRQPKEKKARRPLSCIVNPPSPTPSLRDEPARPQPHSTERNDPAPHGYPEPPRRYAAAQPKPRPMSCFVGTPPQRSPPPYSSRPHRPSPPQCLDLSDKPYRGRQESALPPYSETTLALHPTHKRSYSEVPQQYLKYDSGNQELNLPFYSESAKQSPHYETVSPPQPSPYYPEFQQQLSSNGQQTDSYYGEDRRQLPSLGRSSEYLDMSYSSRDVSYSPNLHPFTSQTSQAPPPPQAYNRNVSYSPKLHPSSSSTPPPPQAYSRDVSYSPKLHPSSSSPHPSPQAYSRDVSYSPKLHDFRSPTTQPPEASGRRGYDLKTYFPAAGPPRRVARPQSACFLCEPQPCCVDARRGRRPASQCYVPGCNLPCYSPPYPDVPREEQLNRASPRGLYGEQTPRTAVLQPREQLDLSGPSSHRAEHDAFGEENQHGREQDPSSPEATINDDQALPIPQSRHGDRNDAQYQTAHTQNEVTFHTSEASAENHPDSRPHESGSLDTADSSNLQPATNPRRSYYYPVTSSPLSSPAPAPRAAKRTLPPRPKSACLLSSDTDTFSLLSLGTSSPVVPLRGSPPTSLAQDCTALSGAKSAFPLSAESESVSSAFSRSALRSSSRGYFPTPSTPPPRFKLKKYRSADCLDRVDEVECLEFSPPPARPLSYFTDTESNEHTEEEKPEEKRTNKHKEIFTSAEMLEKLGRPRPRLREKRQQQQKCRPVSCFVGSASDESGYLSNATLGSSAGWLGGLSASTGDILELLDGDEMHVADDELSFERASSFRKAWSVCSLLRQDSIQDRSFSVMRKRRQRMKNRRDTNRRSSSTETDEGVDLSLNLNLKTENSASSSVADEEEKYGGESSVVSCIPLDGKRHVSRSRDQVVKRMHSVHLKAWEIRLRRKQLLLKRSWDRLHPRRETLV